MNLQTTGTRYQILTWGKDWAEKNDLKPAEVIRLFIGMTSQQQKQIMAELKLSSPKDIIYATFPNYIDRNSTTTVQIRTNSYTKKAICNITKQSNIDIAMQIVFCTVFAFYNRIVTKKTTSFPNHPLLHVMGEKSWFKDDFLEILEQLPEHITKYVDIFGGSGYLTELAQISKRFESVTYNDDDNDKHNFFEVIKKAPLEFKMVCLSGEIPSPESAATESEKKIFAAVNFYMKSIGKKKRQLDRVIEVSKNFTPVHFKKEDGLRMAMKTSKKNDTFCVVDPPYAHTKGYTARNTSNAEKDFSDEKLAELAKVLVKSKGFFIYHCRATDKRNYAKSDKILLTDTYIRGEVDDLFANKGLYVCDYPYGNLGIIERVITNYPFKGFSEYEFKSTKDTCHFFKEK